MGSPWRWGWRWWWSGVRSWRCTWRKRCSRSLETTTTLRTWKTSPLSKKVRWERGWERQRSSTRGRGLGRGNAVDGNASSVGNNDAQPLTWDVVNLGESKPRESIPLRGLDAHFSGVTGMILMWIPTRNPAGGLGGAVSPPAGFGAVARKFLKYMVSFTSEDPFWQISENFSGDFVAEVFSECKAGLQHVIVYCPVLCVCLDRMPQKLFPMFPVRKSDVHWHRYLLCTFNSTSTLQLLNNARPLVFFDMNKGVALSHH